jgi:hypothetical protein
MQKMEDDRITNGVELAEQIWWSLAKKIVFLAGTLYKWDDEQWRDANEKFLRPNDYKVIVGD